MEIFTVIIGGLNTVGIIFLVLQLRRFSVQVQDDVTVVTVDSNSADNIQKQQMELADWGGDL